MPARFYFTVLQQHLLPLPSSRIPASAFVYRSASVFFSNECELCSRAHFVETSTESRWTGNNQLLHSQIVKTRSAAHTSMCNTIDRAHTRTDTHARTLLTLPSQLCRSELLFVCVGSCIYIRGLCQPPHRFPPLFFSNEKQKGQKLLSC